MKQSFFLTSVSICLSLFSINAKDIMLINHRDAAASMPENSNPYRYLFFLNLEPTKELNTPNTSAFKSPCTIPYGNRAVVAHDVTADELVTLKNFYQDTPHAILLCPHQKQDHAETLLQQHNYVYDGVYPLMVHDLENLPEVQPDPLITTIELTALFDIEILWVPIFSAAFKKEPEQVKHFVRYLHATSHSKNIHFYVGFYDGIPAAAGIANIHGTIGALQCLSTHPDFRKKGLGSAMLLHRLHAMKALGVHKAIALASTHGKPLHDKLGFKEEALCTVYDIVKCSF